MFIIVISVLFTFLFIIFILYIMLFRLYCHCENVCRFKLGYLRRNNSIHLRRALAKRQELLKLRIELSYAFVRILPYAFVFFNRVRCSSP